MGYLCLLPLVLIAIYVGLPGLLGGELKLTNNFIITGGWVRVIGGVTPDPLGWHLFFCRDGRKYPWN